MESILMLDRIVRSIKYIFKEELIDLTLNECQVLYLVKKYRKKNLILNHSLKDNSYVHRQLTSLLEKKLVEKINDTSNLEYILTCSGEEKLRKVIEITRICEYKWHIDKTKRTNLKKLLLDVKV